MPFKVDSIYINCPGLNIQRCITYIYVHVCGYLFSTVVCYGYVCLVCVYMHVCMLMRIPSCIDLMPCHLFVSHVLIFSYMHTYWINDLKFLISIADIQCHCSEALGSFGVAKEEGEWCGVLYIPPWNILSTQVIPGDVGRNLGYL